ncbi:MAG: SAM-dependent methyltransferase, partial [Rubripirellula sp.]
MGLPFSAQTQLNSIKQILNTVADPLDLNVSVRLWNGEVVPLGNEADGKHIIGLSGPGVVGSLMRKPTLETLVRLYATGHVSFEGGDLIEFSEALRTKRSNRKRLKEISKRMLVTRTLPFMFAKTQATDLNHGYNEDIVGRSETKRDNTE